MQTTTAAEAGTRNRTISLSRTLAIVMAALVALTAAVILSVVWFMSVGTTRDLLVQSAHLGLEAVQTQIGSRFSPVEDQLAFLAREVGAGRLDPTDPVEFERVMTGALAATPQVRVLSFVRPNGDIYGVTQGPKGVFFFTDKVTSDNERSEIEEAQRSGTAHWGPVYFVPDPAIRTSVTNLQQPANLNGKFAGVFRATITVDTMSDFLRQIAVSNPGTTPFVLYGRDQVLAHPLMAAGHPLLSAEHRLPKLDELGDPFLAALWNGPPETFDNSDMEVRAVKLGDGGRVILTREIRGYAPSPLIIGVEVPIESVEKPIWDLLRAGIAGLVVLLVAIVIAWVVSRMIVRPVASMAREVRAVGRLDFATLQPLPGSLFTELDEQSRAYNTMLTGLRWLETYVPKKLVRHLLANADLASTQRTVTIMFTDVVDFTGSAEKTSAGDVAALLNAHFDLLGNCIEAEGGTIDKFIGDCVMAFWGAPDSQKDHADRAIRAARAIARAITEDNAARQRCGLPPLRLRIGIHSGPVVAGNIGMTGRSAYTIVGDTVNACNRLEQLGKAIAPGEELVMLLSGETFDLVADDRSDLVPLGKHCLAGRTEHTEIYRLPTA
ncbi:MULTISPECIES: adenylate/guanylate cyclase domain-containing protein [Ensifer]|uniref:adenylate/guanylate cyclase domain-containing protein n=1 Tax=Ensifer TaxID=106591 RepID=UPI000DC4CF21|nr:adenylate/guanylate cyclase domain-containing protein [Ensifer adhaerens]MBD9539131.1 adenylate/guanylate cyclase domain-containing protein [Ensifer sp. ENS04]RAS14066.1 class 3 adenylate cyclase [Ensifer adhaerens]